MNGEPIVEKLIIRDGFSYGKDLKIINVKMSEAMVMLDEYCQYRSKNQMQKIWTCRLGWHNFPNLLNQTRCKECNMTVAEVRKMRRRLVEVKNIILHIKMNVRRWRDEQINSIKDIIDAEHERRIKRDDGRTTATENN